MSVVPFNGEVSKDELKRYADAICFFQVGLSEAEISARLVLPEHLVSAWVSGWQKLETAAVRAAI